MSGLLKYSVVKFSGVCTARLVLYLYYFYLRHHHVILLSHVIFWWSHMNILISQRSSPLAGTNHVNPSISQHPFLFVLWKVSISQCSSLLASKKSHEHPVMWIYALHENLHSYWLLENQMDVLCGDLQSDWLVYYKMDMNVRWPTMVRWPMMSCCFHIFNFKYSSFYK